MRPSKTGTRGSSSILIDLGPSLEQGLIDLKLESLPAGEQNPVPNSLHLPDWDPAVIGTADNMQSFHEGSSALDQQYELPPLKRVCLIKPGVRRVINSIQCGGHQIMSEMQSCTEHTIIPLEMYHKYRRYMDRSRLN